MRILLPILLALSGCVTHTSRSVPPAVALEVAQPPGDSGCVPKAGRTECWYVVDTPERFDTGTISVASIDDGPAKVVPTLTAKDKRDLRWFAVEQGADVATTLACGIEGNPIIRAVLGKHPGAFGLIAIKGALLVYQRHQLAQWDDTDSARVVRITHAIGIAVPLWNIAQCF